MKGIFCAVSQKKNVDGIFALVNVLKVYTEGKAVLFFLEQALLGLAERKLLFRFVISFSGAVADL